MLKEIDPRLNADVLYVLPAMGHGDNIIIGDTNFPLSLSRSKVLHRRSGTCMQRCHHGINKTAERSVTRMSDNAPSEKRKLSLTQTPNWTSRHPTSNPIDVEYSTLTRPHLVGQMGLVFG